MFRVRESSLEHHLPWLDSQWAASHHNYADLWRCLKLQGFRGSDRVVREWATRRQRAETPDAQSLQRVPSARTIARLMTNGRDTLSKSETVTVATIERGIPGWWKPEISLTLSIHLRRLLDDRFHETCIMEPMG